jgi:hypothetical protein
MYVSQRIQYLHILKCLFLDEVTELNTWQVMDGHVGGHLFILPKDGSSGGALGSVTDVQFRALPFVSGTGNTILSSIMMKL